MASLQRIQSGAKASTRGETATACLSRMHPQQRRGWPAASAATADRHQRRRGRGHVGGRQVVLVRASQTEEAAAWALAAGPSQLAPPGKPGYRTFSLDTCDFLVAELPEGRLDLRDAYVSPSGQGSWVRPQVQGELPAEPRLYHEVPWYSEFLGNVFDAKERQIWVFRMYLVPVASQEPYELDLGEAFMLDERTKAVSRCEVQRLAPADTTPQELRLRIKPDGVLVVDTAASLPSMERVVRSHITGHGPPLSKLEQEFAQEAVDAEAARQQQTALALGTGVVDEPYHEEDLFLYDEDQMKDFLVEFDDDNDADFDDFDSPASDY